MKKADKKVKEYLERAREIQKIYDGDLISLIKRIGDVGITYITGEDVKIAKMIQEEEHFDPWEQK